MRADAVHPKAPLCKGSCREATEGLCGTVYRFRKCIGEKVRGNDFAAESSGFDGTWAKKEAEQTWHVLTIGTPGSPPLQPLSQLR